MKQGSFTGFAIKNKLECSPGNHACAAGQRHRRFSSLYEPYASSTWPDFIVNAGADITTVIKRHPLSDISPSLRIRAIRSSPAPTCIWFPLTPGNITKVQLSVLPAVVLMLAQLVFVFKYLTAPATFVLPRLWIACH